MWQAGAYSLLRSRIPVICTPQVPVKLWELVGCSPSDFLEGQLKKAASWLFKNAEPLKSLSLASSSRDNTRAVAAPGISGVEVKAESVCICFIDDCMDCDVPLAELTFSRECA